MGNKKKINTYSELISYYKVQVKRLNEVDDLLDELDGKIRPSLVKKRNELNKVRRELCNEIDKLRGFVMDTLTLDEKTFVNLITKFYSFYLGMHLKPIKIRDRKVSLLSPAPAFIIVSDSDYDNIMSNFNTKKPINSDKILSVCKNDYLYFVGDEIYELANGVYLSTEYETFSEMDDVLSNTVTYRLQNSQLSARECLDHAFDEYIRMNDDPFEEEKDEQGHTVHRYKTSFVDSPVDSDVLAEVSREVQRIMAEEKRGVSGSLLGMIEPEKAGAECEVMDSSSVNEATALPNDGEGVIIDTPVETVVVEQVLPGQVINQDGKGKVAEIMEASRQRMAAAQTQGTESKSTSSMLFAMLGEQVEMQQPKGTTVEQRGFKVISSEEVPMEKQTQYTATSMVLLNMLDGSQTKEIKDEEKKGKRKIKKY